MSAVEDGTLGMSWRGPRLRAETARVAGCLVVRLSGELEYTQAPAFRAWLLEAAAGQGETGHVVLDVGGLEFFDSSGLTVVIALWRKARETGHDVAMACSPPICAVMMRRTGLDEFIAMAATVPEAVARLRAGGGAEGRATQAG